MEGDPADSRSHGSDSERSASGTTQPNVSEGQKALEVDEASKNLDSRGLDAGSADVSTLQAGLPATAPGGSIAAAAEGQDDSYVETDHEVSGSHEPEASASHDQDASGSHDSSNASSAASKAPRPAYKKKALDVKPERLDTTLLQWVKGGALAIDNVRDLLEAGATANYADRCKRTPLLLAIRLRSAELVSILLDFEADPNKVIGECHPLIEAVSLGHIDVVDLLLEAGADPKVKQPQPAYSSTRRETPPARLTAGAKREPSKLAESVTGAGDSLLHIAAARGDAKIVSSLLDCQASVHVRDQNRLTPLVRAHSEQVAHLLIQACALIENEMWVLPPGEGCYPKTIKYGTHSQRSQIEARRAFNFITLQQYNLDLKAWGLRHQIEVLAAGSGDDPLPRHAHIVRPPPRRKNSAMRPPEPSSGLRAQSAPRRGRPPEPSSLVGGVWSDER